MEGLVSRAYAGAADLPAILALWPACRPAAWQTDFPSPSDLVELLASPQVAACTRVWGNTQGQVSAYALVDAYDNLWFDRTPEVAEDQANDLVAWGIACARQGTPGGESEAASLDTSCRAEDEARLALLRRHGFTEQAVRTLHFVRSLVEPIPEPVPPRGYTLRTVAGEGEIDALVALHRAAFGTENMTAAERLTWMQMPDYDPDLDLVAVAPDGSLAAYCFCAIHTAEIRLSGRSDGAWPSVDGATDPVATHPAHQDRGLARVLLCAGMRLLQARGATRAVLGTSSDNLAMQAAARAAGYCVESERIWLSWRADE